jgi:CMP-N-acetylneuraminic acid synthetase
MDIEQGSPLQKKKEISEAVEKMVGVRVKKNVSLTLGQEKTDPM